MSIIDESKNLTSTNYSHWSYIILGIIQGFAPTGREQQIAANQYNGMVRVYGHTKDLVRVMTITLYKGLAYGIWPWENWSD